MAVNISGDTGIDKITDGSVVADDLASTLDLSGKTITLATDAVDQLSTASGSAPSYSARAWVNFNGTGTVAIRESGNVSSITDNTTGDYTINFTTAMPDANYSVSGTSSSFSIATVRGIFVNTSTAPSTTSVRVQNSNYVSAEDPVYANIQIFR
jgi:hypothetical protein